MPIRTGLRALTALLTVLLVGSAHLGAQPALSVRTLVDSLMAEIDAANPNVLAARLEASAHQARGLRQAAWPDPVVGASAQPFPILTARGSQRSQWRVEQPIPYPGRRDLTRRIADRDALAADRRADAVLADAALQLKQAVYELLDVQAQALWLDEFEELLEGFEDAAATEYAVGRGSQSAVLRAQLEHNALGRRRLQLEGRRRRAAATAARLLNHPRLDALALPAPTGPSATIDALVDGPPVPEDPDAAVRVALGARPEFQALEHTRVRNDLAVDLARMENRPDFGISLTYTDIRKSDILAHGTGRDALMIGTGLRIPLNRRRIRTGVREAELRSDQTDARIEALVTEVDAEIRNLIEQLGFLSQERTLLEELLIPQAELTLEASQSAYTSGRIDFLNLLDAERALFTLRLDHVALGTRYLQTRAALERALGLRWIDQAAFQPDEPER